MEEFFLSYLTRFLVRIGNEFFTMFSDNWFIMVPIFMLVVLLGVSSFFRVLSR